MKVGCRLLFGFVQLHAFWNWKKHTSRKSLPVVRMSNVMGRQCEGGGACCVLLVKQNEERASAAETEGWGGGGCKACWYFARFTSVLLFSLNKGCCSHNICCDNTNVLIKPGIRFSSFCHCTFRLTPRLQIEAKAELLVWLNKNEHHSYWTELKRSMTWIVQSVLWLSRKSVFAGSSPTPPRKWKQVVILYLVMGFACLMNQGTWLYGISNLLVSAVCTASWEVPACTALW